MGVVSFSDHCYYIITGQPMSKLQTKIYLDKERLQSDRVSLFEKFLKINFLPIYSGTFQLIWHRHSFLKMGHSRPLFLYFRLFYKQLTVNKCSIKVADDWIRTRVLWYWKRPLCQLRHNHCPTFKRWSDQRKDKKRQKTEDAKSKLSREGTQRSRKTMQRVENYIHQILIVTS